MRTELKQHICITMDKDIVERIKVLAKKSDRAVSRYINLVLRKHTISELQKHSTVNGSTQHLPLQR